MQDEIISESVSEITRRQAIQRASLLLGAALSASTLAGIARAQTNNTKTSGKPKHLNRTQFAIVEAMAERIIPKTDTPGAQDVGVPLLIDTLYGGYMTPAEKKTFAQGLSDTNKASRAAHKKTFVDLSGEQQDEIIRSLATGKSKAFLRKMREVTISGYFTSEPVMRNVLNYDFIPGMYNGCMPISETGNKVWAHI